MNGDSQLAPEQTAPPANASAPESPPQDAAQAPGESTDPTAGRKPAAQVDVKALQTGLYDYGRRNKALVEALGLAKDADTEDALKVINQLKQRAAASAVDEYELPPEIQEREQVLLQRSWNAAGRDFGEEFVQSTQGLRDLVMSTNDPYELVQALHEMMSQVSQPPPAESQGEQAPPPGQPQAAPAQASQQPRGVDMEVGRAGWTVSTDDTDKPGSGDTRGFFQKVFGGTR